MPKAERLSEKKKQLAEKRSFEGNCEILRTIFQPRALSSDIPASRKGVYLIYNPPNNFSRRTHVDRSCICSVIHRPILYHVNRIRGSVRTEIQQI